MALFAWNTVVIMFCMVMVDYRYSSMVNKSMEHIILGEEYTGCAS